MSRLRPATRALRERITKASVPSVTRRKPDWPGCSASPRAMTSSSAVSAPGARAATCGGSSGASSLAIVRSGANGRGEPARGAHAGGRAVRRQHAAEVERIARQRSKRSPPSGRAGLRLRPRSSVTASGSAYCSPSKPATKRPPRTSPRASSVRQRARHVAPRDRDALAQRACGGRRRPCARSRRRATNSASAVGPRPAPRSRPRAGSSGRCETRRARGAAKRGSEQPAQAGERVARDAALATSAPRPSSTLASGRRAPRARAPAGRSRRARASASSTSARGRPALGASRRRGERRATRRGPRAARARSACAGPALRRRPTAGPSDLAATA